MPTVLKVVLYRFFFYAGDHDEPQHVHAERDDKIAKFWLDTIRFQSSGGFDRIEITKMHRIINENQSKLLEA
jgi:hypothetical protein